MANKFFMTTVVLCVLLFQSMVMSIDNMTSTRADLQADIQSTRAQNVAGQMGKQRSAPQLQPDTPIKVSVINFTKLDPLLESVPVCEDCQAITVVFSVTCMKSDGCENLSVMDFYITYDSDYPTLFYGDETPNPALQGENYAGIIYGAQKEFSAKSLHVGETTIAGLSLSVKPDASNFVLRYHKFGHDEEDISVPLVVGPMSREIRTFKLNAVE